MKQCFNLYIVSHYNPHESLSCTKPMAHVKRIGPPLICTYEQYISCVQAATTMSCGSKLVRHRNTKFYGIYKPSGPVVESSFCSCATTQGILVSNSPVFQHLAITKSIAITESGIPCFTAI